MSTFCSRCGNQMADTDNICARCGARRENQFNRQNAPQYGNSSNPSPYYRPQEAPAYRQQGAYLPQNAPAYQSQSAPVNCPQSAYPAKKSSKKGVAVLISTIAVVVAAAMIFVLALTLPNAGIKSDFNKYIKDCQSENFEAHFQRSYEANYLNDNTVEKSVSEAKDYVKIAESDLVQGIKNQKYKVISVSDVPKSTMDGIKSSMRDNKYRTYNNIDGIKAMKYIVYQVEYYDKYDSKDRVTTDGIYAYKVDGKWYFGTVESLYDGL